MTATGILTPLGSSCTPPDCPGKGGCVLRTGRWTSSSWSWSMPCVFPWCSSSSFRRLHLIVLSTDTVQSIGQSRSLTHQGATFPLACLAPSALPALGFAHQDIPKSIAATSRVCTSSTIRFLVPLFDPSNEFKFTTVLLRCRYPRWRAGSYGRGMWKKEIHIWNSYSQKNPSPPQHGIRYTRSILRLWCVSCCV